MEQNSIFISYFLACFWVFCVAKLQICKKITWETFSGVDTRVLSFFMLMSTAFYWNDWFLAIETIESRSRENALVSNFFAHFYITFLG